MQNESFSLNCCVKIRISEALVNFWKIQRSVLVNYYRFCLLMELGGLFQGFHQVDALIFVS